jgi:hypothetical protein
LTEDFDLVVNCLDRSDIISDTPVPPTPSFDGVSLTSDKSILSYADSDTCTLTVQLLDDGSPASVSGESVDLFVNGDYEATVITNSSGVASYNYVSTGVGDMSWTAEANNYSSEEITIEDCYLYDTGSADKSSKFATNNVTIMHNTDHYEATTNVANGTVTLLQNIDNYNAEFDMQSSTTGMGCGVFNSTSNHYNAFYLKMWGTTTQIYTSNATGTESSKKNINHSRQNDWYNMTITKQGNSVTITIKRNGSQIGTHTLSISTGINLGMINAYADRIYSFKNMKVKSL